MKHASWYLPNLILVGLIFNLGSCKFDHTLTKIQYMPDMADSQSTKSQLTYIDPPEGSVSRMQGIYPETAEEAEDVLRNPWTPDPMNLAMGKRMYETYCTVCHGADGKGGHSLGDNFPMPPDITDASYKQRGDGFWFHRITFGAAIMPGYGHSISIHERWMLVHYAKTL
jgi:mono/diheme cytochrome c family protein